MKTVTTKKMKTEMVPQTKMVDEVEGFTLTIAEARAVWDLIGNTSHTQRQDWGLSAADSSICGALYTSLNNAFKKHGINRNTVNAFGYASTTEIKFW